MRVLENSSAVVGSFLKRERSFSKKLCSSEGVVSSVCGWSCILAGSNWICAGYLIDIFAEDSKIRTLAKVEIVANQRPEIPHTSRNQGAKRRKTGKTASPCLNTRMTRMKAKIPDSVFVESNESIRTESFSAPSFAFLIT